MTRSSQIIWALVLFGGGALVTFASLASNGSTYIVALGAMIGGLARLVKALSSGDGPQQGFDPMRDPDEPPYSGPQLAGSSCTHCQQKIVSHLVGALCKQCRQPMHLDCRKDHRADAHPRPARAAYR